MSIFRGHRNASRNVTIDTQMAASLNKNINTSHDIFVNLVAFGIQVGTSYIIRNTQNTAAKSINCNGCKIATVGYGNKQQITKCESAFGTKTVSFDLLTCIKFNNVRKEVTNKRIIIRLARTHIPNNSIVISGLGTAYEIDSNLLEFYAKNVSFDCEFQIL